MPSLASAVLVSLFAAGALTSALVQKRDVFDEDCPGVKFVKNSEQGCCVGGTVDPPVLSVCNGWPICNGPTTTTWTSTPISCATIVTLGPDYSQGISSASESLKASGTHLVTPLGPVGSGVLVTPTATPAQGSDSSATETGSGAGATPTGSGSGSTPTGSGSSGSNGSGSGSSGSGSSPSTGAAAAWTAPAALAGGALVAAVAHALDRFVLRRPGGIKMTINTLALFGVHSLIL
ncbi:hypothetical protein F4677DRAFT_449329 [Hypoxylon crocopeplum]|nr:hypothetical protein F4677DRAFT_449329 [Hypoxylon crocopeplum]